MVDNYATESVGVTGITFASDDAAGVHYPYVKLVFGADDTQTLVSTSNALPVNLQTDSLAGNLDVNIAAQTGDVTIADGGNSITVDGTVSVSGTVTTTAATIYVDDADWTALTSSHALIGGVFQSTPGTITDGDTGPLRLTANGAAHVAIQSGGATEYVVDAALGATPTGTLAVAIRDDALSALTPVEGDAIGLRVDANGALWTIPSGTVTIQEGAAMDVSAATVTTTHAGLNAVDSALGATPTGILGLAIRDDALTTLTPVEGDAIGLRVDANGALWTIPSGTVTIQEATALDVSAATVTVDLGANNDVTATGNVAHDVADSGNPVKVGAVARTAHPTAVANNNRVDAYADDLGRMVTYPYAPRDLITHNRITLTTTTETTLVTAAASTFYDLVGLYVSNESATEVRVDIRDSSVSETPGTVRYSIDLAADGGGAIVNFPAPLTQATANKSWTAQLSAGVSTVYVTAVFVSNN